MSKKPAAGVSSAGKTQTGGKNMSKKIKSTWIYDDVKVEFSEPSIQAGESVVHAETTKDIL